VEENIAETLTFYRLPREYHKHLKSTNMLERMNEEIKRRTRVVRIFLCGLLVHGDVLQRVIAATMSEEPRVTRHLSVEPSF
jgi:transposase-like protein